MEIGFVYRAYSLCYTVYVIHLPEEVSGEVYRNIVVVNQKRRVELQPVFNSNDTPLSQTFDLF
jgi:hypothetical protein